MKDNDFYGVKLASIRTIVIYFPIYEQVVVWLDALINGNAENSGNFTSVCAIEGRKDQIAKTLVRVLPH